MVGQAAEVVDGAKAEVEREVEREVVATGEGVEAEAEADFLVLRRSEFMSAISRGMCLGKT